MRAKSAAGMPSESCSRIEKPAAAPMPRTGGGMKTSDCASSICASLSRTSCASLSIVCPSRCRSLEVVEHQEQQTGVGRGRERGAVAAGEGIGIFDARHGQNQIGCLPHHLVRPRQRRARRQLDGDDQDRPIQGRDEAGRKALPRTSRRTRAAAT